MKYLLLIVVLIGCNTSSTKKENKEKKFIDAARKYYDAHRDTLNVVDSFFIVKVDTLTEKYINEYRKYNEERQFTILEQKIKIVDLEVQQQQLYAMMGVRMKFKEKEIADSIASLKKELNIRNTRYLRYDSLSKVSDSTTFIHYLVIIRVVETQPDNTQLKEEYHFIINKDFKVEPRSQFLEN